ncbi:MAG: hypothetical protein N2504_06265 [candidate division WOR-3 bacterium]|nr:hypothetical protein [candidate division WOR-3 bacterium]
MLSYIFPFGLVNAMIFQDFDNDYLRFNVVQGFIVNVLYVCLIIFYFMLKLLLGPIPFINYIANLVGFIFLGLSLFITIRVFFSILDGELYRVPFLGFLVDSFEK